MMIRVLEHMSFYSARPDKINDEILKGANFAPLLFLQVRINGTSFLVWDVGGQDKLRPLWRSYTRCTDGIIFVVDSCKEDRLEEAKLELLKICKTTGKNQIPVLVLANKQDLPVALDPGRLESLLGLNELGPGTQWHMQPTCAITGEGLEEGMEKLHDMIVRRRRLSRNGAMPKPQKVTRKLQRSHSHHC